MEEYEDKDFNENLKLIEKKTEKIGIAGFEPAAFCSQSRHATKLRYIPFC